VKKISFYKKINYYLGKTLFSKIICKNLPLPIQADAIRIALLKKYGGIWMDVDTIITNGEFLKELKDFELVMLGEEKIKEQNIGFIFASKNSSVINEWLTEIIKKIKIYKQFNRKLKRKRKIYQVEWNYLGNAIITICSKLEKEDITIDLISKAVWLFVKDIANYVSQIEIQYEGTKEFTTKKFCNIIRDRVLSYTNPS